MNFSASTPIGKTDLENPPPQLPHISLMKDSSHPDFWNERYARKHMPWDLGGIPSRLLDFLGRTEPRRVLIPGCGTGYEAGAFVRSRWLVDAVDCSLEAVRRAKEFIGEDAHCVRQGTFSLMRSKTVLLIWFMNGRFSVRCRRSLGSPIPRKSVKLSVPVDSSLDFSFLGRTLIPAISARFC